MRLKSIGMIAVLALVLLASLCPADTVTLADMAGRQVKAPLNPQRVVCLGPGALRLIVYLQAVDKVVGVEQMEKNSPVGRPYWHAHPQLAQLPVCGPGGPAAINKKPPLETLLALAPQVIFVTYMEAALADDIQATLQIPVVVLSYGTFATFDEASVFKSLGIAGQVLNRSERAGQVVTYIEKLRKDLETRTRDSRPTTQPVAYVGAIGYRGTQGLDSTELQYAPFDWVGVAHSAKGLTPTAGSHLFVDQETLLRLNPDTIFIDGGGLSLVAEDFKKKPAYYRALKAFAQGRVYVLLPFNYYTTNIGTTMADAYAVGKIAFSQAFTDIDPEKKADEIYTFLVGKPVYANLKTTYGAIGQAPAFLNAREVP